MAKSLTKAMPQEIEVWFVIPAVRRELAKSFLSKGRSQKEAADLLGISEAAISQYLSDKRGNELQFDAAEKKKISETADNILKGGHLMQEMHRLVVNLRAATSVCKMHKKMDKGLPHDCKICLEG
tara:strand:- start:7975 stop:8349 length:375 start_codon:yes stop_codon:yes gene_type:complete